MAKNFNVAIVGLGFGAEFIPIYQRHPNANMYAVCQRTESKLNQIGDAFGVEKRYNSFEKLIEDPTVDIVHINSPIHEHAPMSVAALKAGKHVAFTVPMATSVDECWQIVEAAKASGKKYMMMETVIYSREYLFVKELRDTGKLGKIQFLRASHQQNMYGWPGYWEGLPPMHYATHVVSPCLVMGGSMAEYISCFGSGRIAEYLIPKYGFLALKPRADRSKTQQQIVQELFPKLITIPGVLAFVINPPSLGGAFSSSPVVCRAGRQL